MKKSTSGLRSASQRCTGAKASKMGAHTGSCCFFLSKAKPMVGVWEHATAPMMRAMNFFPLPCRQSSDTLAFLITAA
jgi:hypothetical protein